MRSKLKLDLETLAVDSFGTADETAEKGTVFGEQCTCWISCPGVDTCEQTCLTCQATCSCDHSCVCGTNNSCNTCPMN